MNKLNTNPLGGVKFHQEDIEFWDNANREMFDAITQAFGGNWRIGVSTFDDVNPGGFDLPISWTSGFVAIKGEIFKVIGGGPIDVSSDPDANWMMYYALDESFDPSGSEFNVPGDPIEQYINRRVIIKYFSGAGLAEDEPDFLLGINPDQLPTVKEAFLGVKTVHEYTLSGGCTSLASNKLRLEKYPDGRVEVRGAIQVTDGAFSGGFITAFVDNAPAQYRPSYLVSRHVFGSANGRTFKIQFDTVGGIFLSTSDVPDSAFINGQIISLEGVHWIKD